MSKGQGKLGRPFAMANNERVLAFHELQKSSNKTKRIFFIGGWGKQVVEASGYRNLSSVSSPLFFSDNARAFSNDGTSSRSLVF